MITIDQDCEHVNFIKVALIEHGVMHNDSPSLVRSAYYASE